MTLPGARQRMKDNKEATLRNFEIVERLKSIREELIGMKESLDAFTYEDVEALKENLMKEQPGLILHLLRIRAFTLSFMGAETISQTLINPSQRELRMSEIVIQKQLKLTYVKKELCGAEL